MCFDSRRNILNIVLLTRYVVLSIELVFDIGVGNAMPHETDDIISSFPKNDIDLFSLRTVVPEVYLKSLTL